MLHCSYLTFSFFKYATEAHQIREAPRHVLASIPVTQKMMKQYHITIDFLSMFHGSLVTHPSLAILRSAISPWFAAFKPTAGEAKTANLTTAFNFAYRLVTWHLFIDMHWLTSWIYLYVYSNIYLACTNTFTIQIPIAFEQNMIWIYCRSTCWTEVTQPPTLQPMETDDEFVWHHALSKMICTYHWPASLMGDVPKIIGRFFGNTKHITKQQIQL